MVHVVSMDDVMSDDGENAFQENEVSGGSLLAGDLDCAVSDQVVLTQRDLRWKVYSAPSSARPVDFRRHRPCPPTGFAAALSFSSVAPRSNPPATPKSSTDLPLSRAARYSPHFQHPQTLSRDVML